jgi:hypothetical protein
MVCKGICTKYLFERKGKAKQVYDAGASRCSICEEFLKWEGLWCPCCGQLLRKAPRNTGQKRKRKEAMEIRIAK